MAIAFIGIAHRRSGRGLLTLLANTVWLMLLASFAIDARAAGVAIDVGHSSVAPGATSARGVPEHVFNRSLANEVAAALEKAGIGHYLIGADGKMNALIDRVRAARPGDHLISIHHDSVQEHFLETWDVEGVERRFSDRYAGFSLFVSRKNPRLAESLRCASLIGASMRGAGYQPSLYHAEPIRGESKPFADRVNGVHYFDNLVVLRHAKGPAVLFEAGVIVNREEERRLALEPDRRRMAVAIASALLACVKSRD